MTMISGLTTERYLDVYSQQKIEIPQTMTNHKLIHELAISQLKEEKSNKDSSHIKPTLSMKILLF